MFESVRQPAEPGRAAFFAMCVLLCLWLAKLLGPLAWIGPLALGGAVFLQLWLPLSRCDVWGLSWSALGLSYAHAREELQEAGMLAAGILPLYGLCAAWFYAHGAQWLGAMLGPSWQGALPVAQWGGLPQPHTAMGWVRLVWVCLEATANHVLGVALPEEVFFRGYLQPQWQHLWPQPRPRPLGAQRWLGRAAVLACFVFALGHFVGEWHPGRLLPFFPGLLFAWQRNRRGSLIGCIALHASCNLFSSAWAACFVPQSPLSP